jgi:hypothetical protein
MLTCNPRDPEHRPTWVLKEIGTKLEKHFMLIFNKKTKIFIEKNKLNKTQKQKPLLGNTCLFQNK